MPGQSIRVLVVDEKMERDDRIDEILTAAGFAIRVVHDSVSAAGAVEIWRPSVALVDLRSPSSEAMQFCADLARAGAVADLPVVLVGEGPNLLKPRPVIPSGLVAVPVDPDQLVATVSRVTSGIAGSNRALHTSG
jgi:DNA-binding response OmpR family regulator